jgi:hypothetical protein
VFEEDSDRRFRREDAYRKIQRRNQVKSELGRIEEILRDRSLKKKRRWDLRFLATMDFGKAVTERGIYPVQDPE